MYGTPYDGYYKEREDDAPITDGQILAFREALKVLPVYATYHPEVNDATKVLAGMLESGKVNLYTNGNLVAMKTAARFLDDYWKNYQQTNTVLNAYREVNALVRWYSN